MTVRYRNVAQEPQFQPGGCVVKHISRFKHTSLKAAAPGYLGLLTVRFELTLPQDLVIFNSQFEVFHKF